MRPASAATPIAATGPFAAAFSAAVAMFSAGGPSTTTTTLPAITPVVSPTANVLALSGLALPTRPGSGQSRENIDHGESNPTAPEIL